MRRWQFRRPILGRLVWGWLCFSVLAMGVGAWVLTNQSDKAQVGKIALNVDEEIDRLAPPEPLRLSPPNSDNLGNPVVTPLKASVASVRNAPPQQSGDEESFGLRPGGTKGDASNETDEPVFGEPDSGESADAPDQNTAFRVIKVAAEPENVENTAPGELVITIDGRNIDAPRAPAPTVSAPRTWDQETVKEPSSALQQASQYGTIPKIASDGRKAKQYYARPYHSDNTAGSFGIIVTGLGLNRQITMDAINSLPGPVTLSFAPYGKELDSLMAFARAKGHEVMLEIPLEGYGSNPEQALGPAGLLTTRQTSENQQRLDWVLSRGKGYFGVTNYLGAKFSSDARVMVPVLNRLNDLGLAYIDDTGSVNSGGPSGTPAKIMTINGHTDSAALKSSLKKLAARARRGELALAKMAASPQTIAGLSLYLAGMAEDDVDLAPASAVLYGTDI